MRRIVVFNRLTAGGAFAASDGGLGWSVPDEELDGSAAETIPRFDTMLFGRRTYDMFESFWPHALGDPKVAPDPHHDRRTPAIRAMAVWINEAKKVVFSRTRKQVSWQSSELRAELDPRAIAELKARPGKDMIVFGSGSVVSQLTAHGLVDEYHLIIAPVLIGGGRLMLADLTKDTRLELLEVKAYPSGNLAVRYAPAT